MLDVFLHKRLRSEDFELARKARLLASFSASIALFSATGLSALAIPWTHPMSIGLIVNFVLHTANLIALRKIGRYYTSAFLFLFLMFTMTSLFSFYMGGLYSSSLYWSAVCPLLAMQLVGTRKGLLFVLFPLIEVAVFYWIDVTGYPLPKLDMSYPLRHVVQQVQFIILLVLLGYLSESARKKTNNALVESVKKNHDLIHQRDAAKLASIAKSEFLATMSHELRTPLNAVIGYAEILEEDLEELEEHELIKHTNKIYRAGNHLLILINDILDISKIEAGKADVIANNFFLHSLLKDIGTVMPPLLKPNENTLDIQAADPSICLFGDQHKIRQCLLNLLSNACKFTHHGTITLSITLHKTPAERPPFIEFQVQDTGVGMPQEQIDRIFQKFEQGDNSSTRKYGGIGLGLAITKNYALLMGGDIQCQSTEGKGSTFTLQVPLHYEAANETVETPLSLETSTTQETHLQYQNDAG